MSRLRAASIGAIAAGVLAASLGSSASAAEQTATPPNPAAEKTYQIVVGGIEFAWQVVINTETHTCSLAELGAVKGRCSVGAGERSISGRLHTVIPEALIPITLVFRLHQASGSVAYSGLGTAFYRELGKTRLALVQVQLKS